ncbi:MAG TPA: sulfotransferase [Rhizomicrobium sp.]|nr:sulfotransferase [Rhizomicrobium sp.]
MNVGPDFICIGLPKAGTGWLFDQLNAHPDFWMPPVKELLYLKKPISKMRFVSRSGEPLPNPGDQERRIHRTELDARDRTFLRTAAACSGKPRDYGRYAELFAPKGPLLSGDVSPPYWNLEDDVVEAVAERFPKTRIVLLVRDPVSRAWSRISMAHRSGLFDAAIARDEAALRAYLDDNRKIGTMRATQVAERWRELAPKLSFGIFLFDDIAARPEDTLNDILLFLGADPAKMAGGLEAGFNRKAGEEKLPMGDVARAVLAERFAEELRASASAFGGAAAGWAAKYGL